MMPALVIGNSLPRLGLADVLPQVVYVEMLQNLAILSPLPLLTIPAFPPNLDSGFIDENGAFLKDETGNNLTW